MSKITAISQDYDGCFSLIPEGNIEIFVEQYKATLSRHYLTHRRRFAQKDDPDLEIKQQIEKVCSDMTEIFRQSRSQFLAYINESVTADAELVRMYVGSDRQSYQADKTNDEANHNGSVYQALKQFCEQQNKITPKDWQLEPLLAADRYDARSGSNRSKLRGRALKLMENPQAPQLDYDAMEVSPSFIDMDKKPRASKWPLLLNQMWDLYRENPGHELEFHFIDDRDDVLLDVEAQLKANIAELPPGMVVKLSKFDYVSIYNKCEPEGRPSLAVLAEFQATAAFAEDAASAEEKSPLAASASLDTSSAKRSEPDTKTADIASVLSTTKKSKPMAELLAESLTASGIMAAEGIAPTSELTTTSDSPSSKPAI
jgi:hypothetical protein